TEHRRRCSTPTSCSRSEPDERHSFGKHLFEPEDGRFAVLARNVIHPSAVSNTVSQVRELIEPGIKRLDIDEAGFKCGPCNAACNSRLQFTEIKELQFA